MADIVAVRIQEGEGQRPVDGIKVDGGSSGGANRPSNRRQQIKQRRRHRDAGDDDGEGGNQPVQQAQDFAHHILWLRRVLVVRHV